jgi:hypothetical protein
MRIIEDYNDELTKGLELEEEHKETYDWFCEFVQENNAFPPFDEFKKKIVYDHLLEHTEYYSLLEKAGL